MTLYQSSPVLEILFLIHFLLSPLLSVSNKIGMILSHAYNNLLYTGIVYEYYYAWCVCISHFLVYHFHYVCTIYGDYVICVVGTILKVTDILAFLVKVI